MGDSGALVLGFTLAAVSVAGPAQDRVDVVLFLPLLVLAVPILDTSFVVARRLKHREPVSARRPVAPPPPLPAPRLLAAARCGDDVGLVRDARRPLRSPRASSPSAPAASGTSGRRSPYAAIALLALGCSVYVVYLLEIVKLANPRMRRREERVQDERQRLTDAKWRSAHAALARARKAARTSLKPGAAWALWPAPRQIARWASSRSSRTSQTASNACVVRARDDELREHERRSSASGIVGLPRAPLHEQRARALLELGRERGGRLERRADRPEEAAQERLRLVRPLQPVRGRRPQRTPPRPGGREPRRGTAARRRSASQLRVARRGEQRDHTAVGVAREVVARAQPLRHPVGLVLEVDPVDSRAPAGSRGGRARRARSSRPAGAARATSASRSRRCRGRARAAPSRDRTKWAISRKEGRFQLSQCPQCSGMLRRAWSPLRLGPTSALQAPAPS